MNKIWLLTVFIILTTVNLKAQPNNDLLQAIERFRKAIIDIDEDKLDQLTFSNLSYGHSNGHIENKTEFIKSLETGKYNFLSIVLTDQTVIHSGNIAIVRHGLSADTHDLGKSEAKLKLHVLTVWEKDKSRKWRLLARQAVRI